jgi:peptidoglycan/LPS O-acetylase OafA/YrhL
MLVLREIEKPNFSFKNIKKFLVRRWFRTLPNYYLILSINILVWYIIFNKMPEKLYQYFFFIQNVSARTSSYFYRISWTLSVEQFSYLLAPLLLYLLILVAPAKNRSKLFLVVTLLIILVFNLSRLYFYQTETLTDLEDWNETIRKVLIYRLDAIYYGFLLYYLYKKKKNFIAKYSLELFFAGISLLLFLYIFRGIFGLTIENSQGFMVLLFLPINSLGLCLLFPQVLKIKTNNNSIRKTITTLSIISYPVYLLHYTVILQSLKVIFPSENLIGFQLWAYTFLYWGITFLLSYVLYRFYEKPMTKLRDNPKVKRFLRID